MSHWWYTAELSLTPIYERHEQIFLGESPYILISHWYIVYIYIPRESHVYSLPWILCKSYSLPRPRRPRADHADHALTPFRPSLCCQHRLTVLALTPKQDLNRFPTCKIRLDSYNLIHVEIMTSSVISCNASNPKRHAVRCGCDQHRNK
jgi:hypothetical protein